ncbi:MAG: metal-dependent hydrolase [Defluviitaleaceae bacterium]|nr:metal-dependent hydrolase [Defluviitaleaceae bacterium]
MTGKTHKAIGVAAGVAFSIYGIRHGNPAALLGVVSAPLAAMLPDIDHGGSRIGKTRKMVANIVVAALVVALVAFAWTYSWYIDSYRTLILTLTIFAIPVLVIFGLSQTKFGRSTIGFATKHRGIMHTLLLPIFMFFSVGFINEIYFRILVLGAAIGYFSHIMADCFTTNGCPILFPITKKNISLIKIKTGSVHEKICAAIIITLILVLGFLI